MALQVVIATIFGLLSGYFSGKFDLLLQRLVDAWLSFPGLFVILTVMSLLGPGIVQIIIVLGAFWGIGNIRLIRGVVLSAKENQFVEGRPGGGLPHLAHHPAAYPAPDWGTDHCDLYRFSWRHHYL